MEEVEWEELNDKATTLYLQGRFSKAIHAGKYAEVEPLYKQALEIGKKAFGPMKKIELVVTDDAVE